MKAYLKHFYHTLNEFFLLIRKVYHEQINHDAFLIGKYKQYMIKPCKKGLELSHYYHSHPILP